MRKIIKEEIDAFFAKYYLVISTQHWKFVNLQIV